MRFDDLFQRAMGEQVAPLPFQRAFAENRELSATVRVPTGLGKTAMAVLGWLWRRFEAPEAIRRRTSRRLIYCLPMRALVEQTAKEARGWVRALDLHVGVHVLMGGEAAGDWDLHPDAPAILIGTQDMLLSRALNRGYAMSRYRWPLPFALLHNDCLWILDEVQLMDVGVATSAQLEGFRRSMGTMALSQSVWMSATLRRNWLHTADFPATGLGDQLELSDEDFQSEHVRKLWQARKPLNRADARMGDARACSAAIAAAHRPGTKTLAVFNTVKRAVEVVGRLRKQAGLPEIVLLHSRFRQADRNDHLQALLAEEKELIAVTTQVVEAGVDVSATTLLTELAPWASLVQRFGRCNRRGDDEEAGVLWFDPGEIGDKFRDAAPYEIQELRSAQSLLQSCKSVSLQALEEIDAEMPLRADHVIRRRDLMDLFDTTPDLAGNDIDVSRFIRSGEEQDTKVFWRDFEGKPDSQAAPHREELCSAPIRELKKFRSDHRSDIWRWDGLAEAWGAVEEREIYPGQTYLLRAAAGGYDSATGWNPKSKQAVTPVTADGDEPDAHSRDYETGPWLTIAEHTDDVVAELEEILQSVAVDEASMHELRTAARWHDWGKAHAQFQGAVRSDGRPEGWAEREDVAKAAKGFWKRYDRDGFRHELASALGMLTEGQSDLSAYLAAAHHGKVRLSVRSMPNEKRPKEPGRLYARGVFSGDRLPRMDLGGGETAPETTLSLEPMQMGRSAEGEPSWAERMLRLRDELGPFRLAYLEALLRAADMRASREEAKRSPEECP